MLDEFPIYKPIIAAVNGLCIGGGMVLLSSTDIRVASAGARFAIMLPKRGLFAGGGTSVRYPPADALGPRDEASPHGRHGQCWSGPC